MKRPLLTDAQDMARKYPATFFVPSEADLAGIRPGFFVKVSPVATRKVPSERFWVEVIAISDSGMVGRIDNDLLFTHAHGLSRDDLIEFEQRHIYLITAPLTTPPTH